MQSPIGLVLLLWVCLLTKSVSGAIAGTNTKPSKFIYKCNEHEGVTRDSRFDRHQKNDPQAIMSMLQGEFRRFREGGLHDIRQLYKPDEGNRLIETSNTDLMPKENFGVSSHKNHSMKDASRLLIQYLMTLEAYRNDEIDQSNLNTIALLNEVHEGLAQLLKNLHTTMGALHVKINCTEVDQAMAITENQFKEAFKKINSINSKHLMAEFFDRLNKISDLFHQNIEGHIQAEKAKKSSPTMHHDQLDRANAYNNELERNYNNYLENGQNDGEAYKSGNGLFGERNGEAPPVPADDRIPPAFPKWFREVAAAVSARPPPGYTPYKLNKRPRRKKRVDTRSLISNLHGPLGAFGWTRD